MRYIITSTKFTGELEVRFNTEGILNGFDVRALLEPGMLKYFIKNLPFEEVNIEVYKSPTVTIKPIPDDLSFEAFWKRYNYKVGHKKKAEQMWNRMTDAERMKALAWIHTYEQQLAFTKVAKMFPETYLFQKRYLQAA